MDLSSSISPKITVGLLWHSTSSDNLGVGALTISHIAICEAAAQRAGVDLRYILFGNSGGQNYAPRGVELVLGDPISAKKVVLGQSFFLSQIASCDLVLDIGEGDSFSDIYGLRRFARLTGTKLAVLLKRKPLILSPQTLGPFNRWYTKLCAAMVILRCRKVFARDGISKEHMWSYSASHSIDLATDVAFDLGYTEHEPSGHEVTRIGLNVSGLLFSTSEDHQRFQLTLRYPDLVRRLLKRWTSMPEYEVWLVPHVVSYGDIEDNDRLVCDQLSGEFPMARRAPDFKSPSEAKSFISSLDFFVGARMHACIAAFSSGVPVVAIAYSRKFLGLFSDLGYEWVANGQQLSVDEAENMVEDGLKHRETMRVDICSGNAMAKDRLAHYQEYLVTLFQQVPGRKR